MRSHRQFTERAICSATFCLAGLGRITKIDAELVTRLPGVIAVISHLNAPSLPISRIRAASIRRPADQVSKCLVSRKQFTAALGQEQHHSPLPRAGAALPPNSRQTVVTLMVVWPAIPGLSRPPGPRISRRESCSAARLDWAAGWSVPERPVWRIGSTIRFPSTSLVHRCGARPIGSLSPSAALIDDG